MEGKYNRFTCKNLWPGCCIEHTALIPISVSIMLYVRRKERKSQPVEAILHWLNILLHIMASQFTSCGSAQGPV